MSRRRRSVTKAFCQREHFCGRLWQRYGIRIDRRTYEYLCVLVRAGEARFVERQSNRVTVYDLTVLGKTVRVVYDSVRHCLVTVFPPSEGREL